MRLVEASKVLELNYFVVKNKLVERIFFDEHTVSSDALFWFVKSTQIKIV